MASPRSEAGLSLTGETFRKLTHVFALVMPLVAWSVGSLAGFIIMLPFTLLAIGSDVLRVRSPGFNRFIERSFGIMMRDRELPRVGSTVVLNGATWTLMAFTLLLFVFELGIAVTMFSTFMIGDGAAAMVGRRIGRHKWGRKGCSVEGSAAFFVFGLLTAILIGGGGVVSTAYEFPLGALAAGTLAGAIAEVVPLPVNDNLASPLGAAIVMAAVLEWIYAIRLEYFPIF